MSKLTIFRGPPASGKSTEAFRRMAEDPKIIRINRDTLRVMLGIEGGIGDHEQERSITGMERALFRNAVNMDRDVILDNTNLRRRTVTEWLKLAGELGVEVEFEDFILPYDVATYRDALREKRVGVDVMKMFYDKFVQGGKLPAIPTIDAAVSPTFKPYTYTPGLPSCIIVDIDGTLAHMTGRGPYDTSRYHEDVLDEIISLLVDRYCDDMYGDRDTTVFIMTGRDEEFRKVTENWLARNGFEYDAMFMRPTETGPVKTKDSIVKDRLFEENIAGKYNVDFILDDRNQVVDMWRAKGLKVLQVADGNF